MTHGKSYVVHLNVWLIISHMIDDAIKGNKGIKKKEKENNNKNNKIKKKRKIKTKVKKQEAIFCSERERASVREFIFNFSSLSFFLISMEIGP